MTLKVIRPPDWRAPTPSLDALVGRFEREFGPDKSSAFESKRPIVAFACAVRRLARQLSAPASSPAKPSLIFGMLVRKRTATP